MFSRLQNPEEKTFCSAQSVKSCCHRSVSSWSELSSSRSVLDRLAPVLGWFISANHESLWEQYFGWHHFSFLNNSNILTKKAVKGNISGEFSPSQKWERCNSASTVPPRDLENDPQMRCRNSTCLQGAGRDAALQTTLRGWAPTRLVSRICVLHLLAVRGYVSGEPDEPERGASRAPP